MRDFLAWAAAHGQAHQLTVPARGRRDGPATNPDQRWALLARLLHDDSLDQTARVAGALLLCYGQELSRITTMTRDQVTTTTTEPSSCGSSAARSLSLTIPDPLAVARQPGLSGERCNWPD